MDTTHDFETRWNRVQSRLPDHDADVGVFLEPRSQVYLTGLALKGAVVVPAEGDPIHLVRLNVDRARRESAVDDVRASRGMESIAEAVAEAVDRPEPTVGIETDVVPVGVAEKLRGAFSEGPALVDVSAAILEPRRRKSGSELERMERAADISRRTFEAVPEVFEVGISELELKSELQRVKRGHGAEDGMCSRAWDQHLDFGTLVSGPNTAVISGHWVTMTGDGPSGAQPYGASHRSIEEGDLVVVDHQTVFEGYHCDEARTFVVGEPADRHREVHAILEDALAAAQDAIEPGRPISAIYDAASEVVSGTDYAEGFMGLDQVGFEYVGHMVGLNSDETPLLTPWEDTPIEPGMTFAVEPKILFEGEEGLTLEDTIVATEDGARRLTSTPRELGRL